MTKKSNRANSAQNRTRVNNRRNSAEETHTAVVVENIEPQSQTNTAAVASLPVATETETKGGKVSSKDVLRAAGSIRAAVKEERRGANVTIRLIAERAAAGDAAAVDILCALCDVPRAALFSLNLDKIRAAVNAWYPYYTEVENRRISVKAVGVWYTEKTETAETAETAAKRVKRGYRAVAVVDYLDQLIKAAKSRAKGVKPRRVDVEAIYNDIALSETAEGITAKEIDDAKARRAYSPNAANVWHKDRTGFYI